MSKMFHDYRSLQRSGSGGRTPGSEELWDCSTRRCMSGRFRLPSSRAASTWSCKATDLSAGARTPERAPELPDNGVVGYACGPLRGDWCTVVQAHFYVDGAPSLSDVGMGLSKQLNTHVLSLEVHDGDVFYYYLDEGGRWPYSTEV